MKDIPLHPAQIAAIEHRALARLPRIAEAFRRGEVSYSKVRAMTRVADEANEGYLLAIARNGTALHVEEVVRKYRRVVRVQELERAERQQAERSVEWRYEEDGTLLVRAKLPPEVGALFVEAVEAARAALSAQA